MNSLAPLPKNRGTGKRTSRKVLALPEARFGTGANIIGTIRYWCSNLPDGKINFVAYMRYAAAAGSEVAQQFLAKFDSLSDSDQRLVSLDDVAESMELSVPNLLGTVTAVMAKVGADYARALASLHQAPAMETLAKNAVKENPDFFQDRKLLLEIGGSAPIKQGSRVAVQVNQNNNAPPDNGVPKFENTVNANSRIAYGDDD